MRDIFNSKQAYKDIYSAGCLQPQELHLRAAV